VNKYKMAKHFTWTIAEAAFAYARNERSIGEEAALDGLYVLRTNVPAERMDSAGREPSRPRLSICLLSPLPYSSAPSTSWGYYPAACRQTVPRVIRFFVSTLPLMVWKFGLSGTGLMA